MIELSDGSEVRMCGVVESLGRGGFCRWPQDVITYCIRDQHPRVSKDIWEGEIDWALKQWATAFVLRFDRIDNPNAAHILFTVANLGGPGGVLAQAGLVPCGARTNDDFQSVVAVDSLDNFSDTDRSAVGLQCDLGEVVGHEIGHSLGQGHEERREAVAWMNPQYNPRISGLQPVDLANFSQPGWYKLRPKDSPKPPVAPGETPLGKTVDYRRLSPGVAYTPKKRAWVLEEL